MEGGRMVDRRRPLVMASLTEVRAVPRTLLNVHMFALLLSQPGWLYFCFVFNGQRLIKDKLYANSKDLQLFNSDSN